MYGITLIIPTTNRWTAAAQVLILGCLHLALTFLLLWKFFLSHEEMEMVTRILKRFRPSKRE